MIAPSTLFLRIGGAADPAKTDLDISCNLVQQDTKQRKRCPAGQSALIDAIRSSAGLSVADRGDDDGVFTMPILTQDLSGFSSSLALSYGELSDPEYVTQNGEVKVSLSIADAVDNDSLIYQYKVDIASKVESAIGLDIDAIQSVTAPGKLFNSAGDTVYPGGSVIPVSGNYVLLKAAVVGAVSVDYVVSGALQTATIAPREDVAAGNYQASLWIASTCGQVDNYEIEVPECFQNDWWGKNGYPGDGADGGVGDVTVTDPPNYADPLDLNHSWVVCGPKYAADSATEEFYKDVPGTGKIAYRGVRIPNQESSDCYDGGDYD